MSRYKCHPIPTRSQGGRKTELRRREKQVAKQGSGRKAAGTKLVLYQGHMQFPSKPLLPASQGLGLELHLDSADCSATLT